MSETENGGFIKSTVKGVFLSVIITLVFVAVFALIIKLTSASVSVIKPVNQFIKVLSVFLGCFFSLKGDKGYLKGILVGIFAVVITYLLFALIGGGVSFKFSFLIDILFCAVVGMISGILTVNLKK